MPNIAVTNFCNLSCPYCFANEFIAESDKQYLTQEQLITILNFLTTSSRSLGKIGIIGGEPTLHPNIKNLIETVKSYVYSHGGHIVIFSNGIKLDSVLSTLDDKCSVLINLNEPNLIGPSKWKQITDNLNKAKVLNLTKYISLGINLYPDIKDYEYIFIEAKKIYAKSIRVSYVAPTKDYSVSNKDEYYENAKSIFLNFLELSEQYNIKIHLDCNRIPSCYFTEEELVFVESRLDSKDNNQLDHYCRPVVDITPDFKATACFGTYKTINLQDFDTFDALEQYLEAEALCPLREKNATHPKCASCEKLANKTCQGGCLGFAKNAIYGSNE